MTSPETDTDAGDALETATQQDKPKMSLEVKIDKRSACQRHVTVTISRDDIDRYLEDAFSELQPKAEVPGFRPGRAPRKLVENRFRRQVVEQVKGSLLMDGMTQVNEEYEFSAISEPDFDFEAIEVPEEGPMTFEFDLEVRPEFELPQWKGMELELPVRQNEAEDVERQLKMILSRHAQLVSREEPVEPDDFVTVDITFRHEDQVVSEAQGHTVQVKPVLSFRDAKLEGFDELMIGAKAGDRKTAKITVSPEADNEQLRGQEVDVEFRILEVKRRELPELKAVLGRLGEFEDEEQLREAVRIELQRQLVYYQQQRVRRQIAALLTESADWDLPPDMLRRQAGREMERAVLELRASGFSDEVIRAHQNELRQNSMAATATALKEHFILERIAEQEGIDADPQDFDLEIRRIAVQSDESPRRIRARLEKRGQMDALRNQIIERKAIELIVSHAKFKETPLAPPSDQTSAVDHAVGGQGADVIPEAKYSEAQQMPERASRV